MQKKIGGKSHTDTSTIRIVLKASSKTSISENNRRAYCQWHWCCHTNTHTHNGHILQTEKSFGKYSVATHTRTHIFHLYKTERPKNMLCVLVARTNAHIYIYHHVVFRVCIMIFLFAIRHYGRSDVYKYCEWILPNRHRKQNRTNYIYIL